MNKSLLLLTIFIIGNSLVLLPENLEAKTINNSEKAKTDNTKKIKVPEKKKVDKIQNDNPYKVEEKKQVKQKSLTTEIKPVDTEKLRDEQMKTDKNPYIESKQYSDNPVSNQSQFSSVIFEVVLREGFALNSGVNPKEISLKSFAPGGGVGISYYFTPNLGIHAEGNAFIGQGLNSVFVPVTIRFKPIISKFFDLHIGAGGFASYVNNQFPIGAIAEIGGVIKFTKNIGVGLGFDYGMTFTPLQSQTVGIKSGIVYSL